MITPNTHDQTYTYCSELVWQSFYYGAGERLTNYWAFEDTPLSIIDPYDFEVFEEFEVINLVNY